MLKINDNALKFCIPKKTGKTIPGVFVVKQCVF